MPVVRLSNDLTLEVQHRRDAEVLRSSVQSYFTQTWSQNPESVIIDVGANVGMFTLECLRRSGGRSRIVCCEPAPPNFDLLTRNIAANFPSAQVMLKPIGLSDRCGTSRFHYRPVAPYLSSLDDEPMPDDIDRTVDLMYTDEFWSSVYGKSLPKIIRRFPRWLLRRIVRRAMQRMTGDTVEYSCQLCTLSALIDEEQLDRIDVLKIDVEGAEWGVLMGLEDRHWPLVHRVLIEVHDLDGRLENCRELFQRHALTNISVEQEFLMKGGAIYNLVASRPTAPPPDAGSTCTAPV